MSEAAEKSDAPEAPALDTQAPNTGAPNTGAPNTPGAPDVPEVIFLLQAVERRLDIGEIDRFWVFSERAVGSARSTLVVLSAYEESGDRRRVLTARNAPEETAPGNGRGARHRVVEEGIAPADRIGRLVEGVLRRLDDEVPEEDPVLFEIGGNAERWAAALEDLGNESDEVAPKTKESNNSY